MAKQKPSLTVETLRHEGATRKHIPPAEYQTMLDEAEASPVRVAYERRNRDLDPQLVWRGKDEQDWSDLVVQAPPLYIQEKIHPKVLIDDLMRHGRRPKSEDGQPDLFADFNGVPEGDARTEFYRHDANWSNRMILGDSLQVMASLAEREGLRGQVQCIYFDPPYGIKFNSNFQWSTTSRDVKDGNTGHITREPEQVKAFRDTWRDGIHSYLTYLRDRLTVARDLLSDSGSIFVQIGDENVHRVRTLMDEVFGEDNFVATINYQTSTGTTSTTLDSVCDYLLWYAKNKPIQYFQLYAGEEDFSGSGEDIRGIYELGDMTSQHRSESRTVTILFQNKPFNPSENRQWAFDPCNIKRLQYADRVVQISQKQIRWKKYADERARRKYNNIWTDTQFGAFNKEKIYVVQTPKKLIERCILMTTKPGDLVLDPTCGSGTTAYVAEQWGRRWITIDTSRVALALARARLMGARYPYYILADSPEGQLKEAEVTGTAPSTQPTHNDIRHGFVYERVPHITLKSIANNAEIDVIWESYQEKLEPLRARLNAALGKTWEEWEIPREAISSWPDEAKAAHAEWWRLRIARQKEIDASIAAKAEFEYLYDRPYEDRRKVRVAGPFTVESLSPHRVLAVGEDDELIDEVADPSGSYGERDFAAMILENLRIAGVQQAHKIDKITFTSLVPWPGNFVCAEGRYTENANGQTVEKRAAIFIGPEFGTVSRPDLVEAAREAADAGFDVLIACAFNYDAHTTEFSKLGRIPVLKARMNADLHMAEDLKNTGKGNLFVIFGEPDIEVHSSQWLVDRHGKKIASYELVKEFSGLTGLEEINRLGRADLQRFKDVTAGRTLWDHEPDSKSSRIGGSEHSGGSGSNVNGGVSPGPERSQWLAGGSGDPADPDGQAEDALGTGSETPAGPGGRDRQNALRAQAIAAVVALQPESFPLSLTTDHYVQVAIRGVDVFHPNTGEVRSDGPEGIACWFIDTDYNQESFFVRHAYFLGAGDPYKALKTTLKAEIDEEAWASLRSDTSRPFDRPAGGRIAVKVINHLGDEVMKVFKIS